MTRAILAAICFLALGACDKEQSPSPPAKQSEPAPPTSGQSTAPDAIEQTTQQVEQIAKDAADKAQAVAKDVSAEAKAQMDAYLAKVGDLTNSLSGLKGGFGDLASAGDVKQLIADVKTRAETLLGLDPGTLDALKKQYAPQLQQATSALKAQIDRIGNMPQFASIKGWLDKLPLIQ